MIHLKVKLPDKKKRAINLPSGREKISANFYKGEGAEEFDRCGKVS